MQHNLAIFLVIFILFGCSKPEIKGDDLLYYNFCTADTDCQLVEKEENCWEAANKHDIELAKEIFKNQFGCNFDPKNAVAKCKRNTCVVEGMKVVPEAKPNNIAK